MGMYCFGIDVGGTSVKCGLFLTNGTLVEQWEIPTRLENNGSSILPDVADAIKTKLDERGITKDNVDGVGIGIPGPVNENGEVPMAVNLHWGFKVFRQRQPMMPISQLLVRHGRVLQRVPRT